jgi:hypothetical protein
MSMLSILWTSVLEGGHALREDLSNLRELIDLRIEGLFAKPGLVGPLFGYLRDHAPILVVPGLAVVAKYAEFVRFSPTPSTLRWSTRKK